MRACEDTDWMKFFWGHVYTMFGSRFRYGKLITGVVFTLVMVCFMCYMEDSRHMIFFFPAYHWSLNLP